MFDPRIGASIAFVFVFGTAFGQFGYRDLHDFGGQVKNAGGTTGLDGESAQSGISFDASGNAYGATNTGGPNGMGMIWEITSAGVYKDLHDFGGDVTNADGSLGPDGENPFSGVSIDSSGNLYGTTYLGGPYGPVPWYGMAWEITAAGVYKDLHDFGGSTTNANGSRGPDGYYPYGNVSFDSSGNIYGTAYRGGPYGPDPWDGMVWEITSGGVYKDLHDFGGTVTNADGASGADGKLPTAGITVDSSKNLFGTAEDGGPNGFGNIWEITSAGVYKDLHDFGGTITNANGSSGPDGEFPVAGVTLDSAGDKIGATIQGGASSSFGMVWEITAAGAYKDLHDFGGTVTLSNGSSGTDGENPYGNIGLDSAGDMFGTALSKGGNNAGMVWEITAGGTYFDLHDFGGTITNANGSNGPDGTNPYDYGNIGIDSSGNVYGTTNTGGASGDGMVWELFHEPKVSNITLNPSTIGGLGTTTATITIASAAPTGGAIVNVHPGASGYLNMPSSVMVPAGATTATFTITGTAQRPSTINMGVFATNGASSAEAVLTIQGDSLKSFTLSPSQIKWTSGTSTATLMIGSAAPPGGWKVTLTPGVSGYVNMPTSVTIPAGATSTTFTITGNELRFFTLNLGILASDGGSDEESTLIIAGDAVKSITLSPSTIGWGGTSTVTVNLVVAAPPGGWLVDTNPGSSGYVSMPTSITVPAGATSATFTVTAGSQRSSNLSIGIYAHDGPSNQSAILTIQGDSVKSLSLNPSSITWTKTSTATVTLASAAPPGGWVLTLHAGASGYVTMPATITVPAGATTATFTITAGSQRSATVNLGIFVSDGNSSQEAILTIT